MIDYQVYHRRGLSVNIEGDEKKLRLRAHGPLAVFTSPILNKINRMLESEKPIAVKKDAVIFSTWLPPIPSGSFKRLIDAEIDIALHHKYVPQAVSLNAFKQCSYSCENCNMVRSPGPELSTEELKGFIDQVVDLGAVTIGFSEGDPLTREDIVDLVRYVDKNKAIASIFTPGAMLTESQAENLKRAGLYAVIIGFCSPIPDEHDAARGVKGAFSMATKSIKNALDAGLYVSIHTHANPRMIAEKKLDGLYDLASQLNVHEFTIWEAIPSWGYRDKDDLMLNKAQRDYILEMRRKLNKMPAGPRIFSMSFFEGPDFLGCMAGRRWLNLVDSGDLTPCIYTPISFGNIKNEKVADIWKKMRENPLYRRSEKSCMMLNPEFRSKFIKKIPYNAKLPVPLETL
ncbi:MAG TPA: radical SAM protein [archaeon]|nr:radical SAM protein [archaeon]